MQAFLSLALAATRTPKDELLLLAPLAPLAPGTGGCALAVSDDSVPLSAVPNCVPWFGLQTQLAKEAAAYTPAPSGNSTLVLLGDSITEHLRGTQVGAPHLPVVADGARGLLERWPSHLLLGSSGDLAADLLWRLGDEGGQLSDAMRDDPALLINLLVGTNGAFTRLPMPAHSLSHTTLSPCAPDAQTWAPWRAPRRRPRRWPTSRDSCFSAAKAASSSTRSSRASTPLEIWA